MLAPEVHAALRVGDRVGCPADIEFAPTEPEVALASLALDDR